MNTEIMENAKNTGVSEMESILITNDPRNQKLYGDRVQKLMGCAVVNIETETIVLELPITYPQLLSAIIKRRYSSDQAEAVTANFLAAKAGTVSDEKALEYTAEYEKYQEWRNLAKTVAKEVMGIEA